MAGEPLSRSATNLLARLYERDLSTHGVAVANLTIGVGQELGLAEAQTAEIMRAAVFHDVGKLEVPRELLDSPRRLRPREWAVMRTHPERGERLVRGVADLASLAPVVRHHHERWDGDGYPDRLAGGAIPLGARIVFACDAFDAMTSPRPYRPTLGVDEALEEVDAGAGTQFDPVVAAALMKSVTSSPTLARVTAGRHH
jgi:HD-GYP domain-containing protein (c-di-GMP phosphodiesterase class II)